MFEDLFGFNKINFLFNKKIEGDYENILNNYTKEQLEHILNFLNISYKSNLKKKKLVELLKNYIFNNLDDIVSNLPIVMLENLDDLVNDSDGYCLELCDLGLTFGYDCADDYKLYLPNDLKNKLKHVINKDVYKKVWLSDIKEFVKLYFWTYGLVSKEIIVEEYESLVHKKVDWTWIFEKLNDEFTTCEINNVEFLWPKSVLLDPLKEDISLDFYYPGKEIIVLNMAYCLDVIRKIAIFLNIEDERIINSFIKYVLLKYQDNAKIVSDFTLEYNLNKKQRDELEKILDVDFLFPIWQYGGRTKEQHDIKYFNLTKMPKDKKLLSCLKALDDMALSRLYDAYDVKSLKALRDAIMMSFEDIVINFDNEFIDYLLNIDEVEDELPFSSGIVVGFFYLYKGEDKESIIIPREIEQILKRNTYDDDIFGNDLIYGYLVYNGALERKTLQSILESRHDIHFTLSELDRLVISYGAFIQNGLYVLINNMDKDILKDILVGQEKYGIKELIYDDTILWLDDIIADELGYVLEDSDLKDMERDSLIASTIYMMHINKYSLDTIKQMMQDNGISLNKRVERKFDSKVIEFLDEIPLWVSGGYSHAELDNENVTLPF